MRTMRHHLTQQVREAVAYAMRVYPNSHLGDLTAREDMRSAFFLLRTNLNRGCSIQESVGALVSNCYRYEDM